MITFFAFISRIFQKDLMCDNENKVLMLTET